jgi:hypothetical protein
MTPYNIKVMSTQCLHNSINLLCRDKELCQTEIILRGLFSTLRSKKDVQHLERGIAFNNF